MMTLLVRQHCNSSGISVGDYFRVAYVWRFQKVVALMSLEFDIARFELYGIVPEYVCEYVCSRLCDSPVHTVLGVHDDSPETGTGNSGHEEIFSERFIPRGL